MLWLVSKVDRPLRFQEAIGWNGSDGLPGRSPGLRRRRLAILKTPDTDSFGCRIRHALALTQLILLRPDSRRVHALPTGAATHAFEAVGAQSAIRSISTWCAKGHGHPTEWSPAVELPLQSVVTRQITLYGSCAMAGEYPVVLDLMARKKIDVRALVSAVAPLSEGRVVRPPLQARTGPAQSRTGALTWKKPILASSAYGGC